MAFELTITAPFRFSFTASSGHLSMLFGRHERGFVLLTNEKPPIRGKWGGTWRNPACGTLNLYALGVTLLVAGEAQESLKGA